MSGSNPGSSNLHDRWSDGAIQGHSIHILPDNLTVSNNSDLVQDKIIQFKLEKWGHNPTAEQYLIFYKFGDRVFQAKDKAAAIEEFKSLLQKEINPRNLRCYVESFRNRTDISEKLMEKLKCDTLLLVGDKVKALM